MKKIAVCLFLSLAILGLPSCSIFNNGKKPSSGSESLSEQDPFVWSKYYSVSKCDIVVPNACSHLLMNNGVWIEEYDPDSPYEKAVEEIREMESDEKQSIDFPRNPNGDILFPETTLSFFSFQGERMLSIDENQAFGTSLANRVYGQASENDIVAVSICTDARTGQSSYSSSIVNKDGKITKTSRLKLSQPVVQLYDVMVFNGQIYVTGADENSDVYVFEFDQDGKEIGKQKLRGFTSAELVVGEKLNVFDFSQGLCSEMKELKPDDIVNLSEEEMGVFSRNGQIYVFNSEGIHRSGENAALLNWHDVCLSGSVAEVIMMNDHDIAALGYSPTLSGLRLYLMSPVEQDPCADKYQIVIAGYDIKSDEYLRWAIDVLNDGNQEYQYVIRDYKEEISTPFSEENYHAVLNRVHEIMRLDIASGNSPDLYYDKFKDLYLWDFCKEDYLVDLSAYMKKLDGEYYWDIMKMHQEDPYAICTDFSITCFAVLSDIWEKSGDWTFEDFDSCMNVFEQDALAQGIFTKDNLLEYALTASMDSYVDVKQGKTLFDQQQFHSLLKWVNRYGCGKSWERTGIDSLENRQIMMDWVQFNDISIMLLDKALYPNVRYIGFPCQKDILPYYARNILAISAQSKHKDQAWNLIGFMLSDDMQMYVVDNPVRVSAMRWKSERVYESMKKDEDLFHLTLSKDEYLRQYDEILSSAKVCSSFGSLDIMNIILEEAKAYFSGDRDLERTIEIIQNRANIYVSEVR